MKNTIAFILIILALWASNLQAQDSGASAIPKKKCLLIDSVSFKDSIVLSQLLEQTDCQIVDCNKSPSDTLAIYSIVSYKFTYLSKKLGFAETRINGNSLAGIHKYLMLLEPGDFIQFSEILGIRPLSDKGKDRMFYLSNQAGILK